MAYQQVGSKEMALAQRCTAGALRRSARRRRHMPLSQHNVSAVQWRDYADVEASALRQRWRDKMPMMSYFPIHIYADAAAMIK